MLERLSRRIAPSSFVVAVIAVIAYASVVTSSFSQLDDPLYVTANARVHATGLSGLMSIWSPVDALAGRFIEFFPLRDTVYWLVWAAFPENPVPFHVVGLLAHVVASILVCHFARALGVTARTSFVAAAIFAAHPIHIESVAWVAGLKDPLYVSFVLLACICWLKALQATAATTTMEPIAARYRRHAVLWMVAGLLCKSMAFVTPALFAVFMLTHRPRLSLGTMVRWLTVPAVVAGAFLALFLVVGRANDVITGPTGGQWLTHYQVVSWVSARYLQQALLPFDFRLHYCFDTDSALVPVRAAIGVAAMASYAFVCLRARRHPLALRLLLWGPITLFPVMNIVPFPALMADRYLYAASVAVCIGAAAALTAVPQRLRDGAVVAVVVVLAAVTSLRASLWHTPVDLWQPVVDDPLCADAAYPLIQLGQAQASEHHPQASLEAFHASMNKPAFARIIPLMRCSAHLQAAMQALDLVPANVALAQRHARAAAGPCLADSDELIAVRAAIVAQGSDEHATLVAAEAAVDANPDVAGLLWNRGLARTRVGRNDEGLRDLEDALRNAPAVVCALAVATVADPNSLVSPGTAVPTQLVDTLRRSVAQLCPTPTSPRP